MVGWDIYSWVGTFLDNPFSCNLAELILMFVSYRKCNPDSSCTGFYISQEGKVMQAEGFWEHAPGRKLRVHAVLQFVKLWAFYM